MNLRHFRNPPSQYRSAPFWSWNDRLSDEELVRQVRMFHTVGIGSFFMHSRVGLTGQAHPLRSRKCGKRRVIELDFPPNASLSTRALRHRRPRLARDCVLLSPNGAGTVQPRATPWGPRHAERPAL